MDQLNVGADAAKKKAQEAEGKLREDL